MLFSCVDNLFYQRLGFVWPAIQDKLSSNHQAFAAHITDR